MPIPSLPPKELTTWGLLQHLLFGAGSFGVRAVSEGLVSAEGGTTGVKQGTEGGTTGVKQCTSTGTGAGTSPEQRFSMYCFVTSSSEGACAIGLGLAGWPTGSGTATGGPVEVGGSGTTMGMKVAGTLAWRTCLEQGRARDRLPVWSWPSLWSS